MTKPRRYGGKSHPATPTQEQTRPISTETSNLYKTYTVSDISCVNGHCQNKTLQINDQTAQIWWKISSRDANSGANETNIDGNEQSRQKIRHFWCLLQKRALKKKTLQADDQTAQVWGKISSRDANSGANETNIDGN